VISKTNTSLRQHVALDVATTELPVEALHFGITFMKIKNFRGVFHYSHKNGALMVIVDTGMHDDNVMAFCLGTHGVRCV